MAQESTSGAIDKASRPARGSRARRTRIPEPARAAIKRFLRRQASTMAHLGSHLSADLREADDVRFLLCFTLPNSGSTALAKLLMSGRNAVALTDKAEGEWLIPQLSRLDRRYRSDHVISPRKLRARWLMKARRQMARRSGGRDDPAIVIEKSPSNVARHDWILDALGPMVAGTILLTRDPYAVCASWHRRYGRTMEAGDGTAPGPLDDRSHFQRLGRLWAERMAFMDGAAPHAKMVIRYEDLTADPAGFAQRIGALFPELADISAEATVRVKDYPDQQLSNMNGRQIGTLDADAIGWISEGLADASSLVERYGYAIR